MLPGKIHFGFVITNTSDGNKGDTDTLSLIYGMNLWLLVSPLFISSTKTQMLWELLSILSLKYSAGVAIFFSTVLGLSVIVARAPGVTKLQYIIICDDHGREPTVLARAVNSCEPSVSQPLPGIRTVKSSNSSVMSRRNFPLSHLAVPSNPLNNGITKSQRVCSPHNSG